MLFGHHLGLDDLQFAYQKNCSPSMCTWGAVETVGYFLRNGSEVFSCLMDMTKAFDNVKYSVLFSKLIRANVSSIFIRVLFFIYVQQFANIRCDGIFSNIFPIRNGVRQGAFCSGILYCFYCNDLFEELRRSGYGCWINGTYCGIWGYSDDNFLLAPSEASLQEMINICERYAASHNLQFSTDQRPGKCKTKCLAYLKKPRHLEPRLLCGNPLPWVTQGLHLGHHISNKYNGMKLDAKCKRAQYISKNCELNQEFSFAHPDTKFKVNSIYNSHMTGSVLWNLFSKEVNMIENSWNVSFRCMYNLPLQTHRYMVEPISNQTHIQSLLYQRFIGFIDRLEKSDKTSITTIFRAVIHDTNSTTGFNLRNILLKTNRFRKEDLSPSLFKSLSYQPIPESEEWRIEMIRDIIKYRYELASIECLSYSEIQEILNYVCII